jgi:hypothetical protein
MYVFVDLTQGLIFAVRHSIRFFTTQASGISSETVSGDLEADLGRGQECSNGQMEEDRLSFYGFGFSWRGVFRQGMYALTAKR